MNIEDYLSKRSVHNSALSIYSKHFDLLHDFYEFIGGMEASIEAEDLGKKLNRRQKLQLLFSKVSIAIKILMIVLGRPPAIAEIAEVAGEARKKVYRFLKGEYKSVRPEWLSYDISFMSSLKLDYVRNDGKRFRRLRKRPGRPNFELDPDIGKNSGPSSQFVVTSTRAKGSGFYRMVMSDDDVGRLREYLTSKLHIDLFKSLLKRMILFGMKMRSREGSKLAYDFISPIGKKALKIAKLNESPFLSEYVRRYFSFEWLKNDLEERASDIQKMLKEVDEFSNEEITSFFDFEDLLNVRVSNIHVRKKHVHAKLETLLICGVCYYSNHLDQSKEEVTCASCGMRYRKIEPYPPYLSFPTWEPHMICDCRTEINIGHHPKSVVCPECGTSYLLKEGSLTTYLKVRRR